MRLSRFFSTTLILGASTATAIIACGGDDDATPDALVYMDAKVFMDAPAALMGLGTVCTTNMAACTGTDAPTCIGTGSQSPRFCTGICGMGGSAMPPAGGQEFCSRYTGTGGTPLCALAAAPMGGSPDYTWFCGVGCGMFMGNNLGTCPAGLTCQSNLCQ